MPLSEDIHGGRRFGVRTTMIQEHVAYRFEVAAATTELRVLSSQLGYQKGSAVDSQIIHVQAQHLVLLSQLFVLILDLGHPHHQPSQPVPQRDDLLDGLFLFQRRRYAWLGIAVQSLPRVGHCESQRVKGEMFRRYRWRLAILTLGIYAIWLYRQDACLEALLTTGVTCSRSEGPIDATWLWVNGSDPAWAREKDHWAEVENVMAPLHD